ncbi:MAG: hypothetical protein ACRD1E_08205, partial [Terriglobales bacterium]
VFLQGVAELRALLAAAEPDPLAAERALTRIAVRFPDQAEQLVSSWGRADRTDCEAQLAGMERLYAEDDAS